MGTAQAQTYQSVDLGSATVGNGPPSRGSATFSFSGLSAQPHFAFRYGSDFGMGTPSCNSDWTNCILPLTFYPTTSGLRQNAIVATDGSGNLLGTAFLHGIGLSSKITFSPGRIALRSTVPSENYYSKVKLDAAGDLYYATSYNGSHISINRLPAGSSTPVVLAGAPSSITINGIPVPQTGDNIEARTAAVGRVDDLAVDAAGNVFYVEGQCVRKIDVVTGLVRTVAGSDVGVSITEGAQATSVRLDFISSIGVDLYGNLYLFEGTAIRKVDLSVGIITTVAVLQSSGFLCIDGNGILFASVYNTIRKIDPVSGTVRIIAGTGSSGAFVEGSLAAEANLPGVRNLTIDLNGNLYFSDAYQKVLKLNTVTQIVRTIAGNDSGAPVVEGALANTVRFNSINSIDSLAVDAAGNLFLSSYPTPIVEVVMNSGVVKFPAPIPGGTAASQTIEVTNFGSQDLLLNSKSLNGPYELDTTGVHSCQFLSHITPGEFCTLVFVAAMPGNIDPGSALLFDNQLNRVTIDAILLQIGSPISVVSATNLDFGTVQIGTKSITIKNDSADGVLALQSLAITGTDASEFKIASSCSLTTPLIIPAQGICTYQVTFAPVTPGPKSATLTFSTNAPQSPQMVSLSGIAAQIPVLDVSPLSLDFGNQSVGSASAQQTITLTNKGTGLLFLSVTLIGAGSQSGEFQLANSSSCFRFGITTSLPPASSCTVTVYFAPKSIGPKATSLFSSVRFPNSTSNSSIAITGTGGPPSNLRFVPVTPCRIADTRESSGPFGGPMIAAQSSRDFDLPGSDCGIPRAAAAYSLNVTAVPSGPLSWITVWPAGQTKPAVSTLNSFDGRTKANAAIVPAGTNGVLSLFATDATNVVLDINGYFIAVTDDSALAFYPIAPCRVVDTRDPDSVSNGPFLVGKKEREIAVLASRCNLPVTASAYSMNFTAVPHASLSYLTVWPSGQPRPLVSTLNAPTGTVVANAAVVPAGQGGDISVYATDDSDLIVDVNGYFAPVGSGGLSLHTVNPCRVFDSRETATHEAINGPLSLPLTNSCNLPAETQAIISNATVIPSGAMGYLSLWPSGQPQPTVSTLNAYDATVTSNLAIVPTGGGAINAFTAAQTHLILDVSAYFAP